MGCAQSEITDIISSSFIVDVKAENDPAHHELGHLHDRWKGRKGAMEASTVTWVMQRCFCTAQTVIMGIMMRTAHAMTSWSKSDV